VIVAAGTPQRQSQKGRADGSHNIVELIVTVDQRIGWFVIPGAQPQKGRGDQCFGGHLVQFITRQLFGQKAVEGLVGIP